MSGVLSDGAQGPCPVRQVRARLGALWFGGIEPQNVELEGARVMCDAVMRVEC